MLLLRFSQQQIGDVYKSNDLILVFYCYGYTSTSSPFIALHRAVTTGQIQRGDKVLFWTVGAGWQNVAMVVEY